MGGICVFFCAYDGVEIDQASHLFSSFILPVHADHMSDAHREESVPNADADQIVGEEDDSKQVDNQPSGDQDQLVRDILGRDYEESMKSAQLMSEAMNVLAHPDMNQFEVLIKMWEESNIPQMKNDLQRTIKNAVLTTQKSKLEGLLETGQVQPALEALLKLLKQHGYMQEWQLVRPHEAARNGRDHNGRSLLDMRDVRDVMPGPAAKRPKHQHQYRPQQTHQQPPKFDQAAERGSEICKLFKSMQSSGRHISDFVQYVCNINACNMDCGRVHQFQINFHFTETKGDMETKEATETNDNANLLRSLTKQQKDNIKRELEFLLFHSIVWTKTDSFMGNQADQQLTYMVQFTHNTVFELNNLTRYQRIGSAFVAMRAYTSARMSLREQPPLYIVATNLVRMKYGLQQFTMSSIDWDSDQYWALYLGLMWDILQVQYEQNTKALSGVRVESTAVMLVSQYQFVKLHNTYDLPALHNHVFDCLRRFFDQGATRLNFDYYSCQRDRSWSRATSSSSSTTSSSSNTPSSSSQ